MKFNDSVVLRSSEHVSPSHPDKVCDLVVERLLYETQCGNPGARFACDGAIKNNVLSLVGEVSHRIPKDKENSIILNTLEELGYGKAYCEEFDLTAYGKRFGWYINKTFTTQSADIAMGVDSCGENRASAGDIGIMFGYASKETPCYVFAPHYISKFLMRRLYDNWETDYSPELRPDMKALATVEYVNGVPRKLVKLVLCVSHAAGIDPTDSVLAEAHISLALLEEGLNIDCSSTNIVVNPTGQFSIYGPVADSGLVGRKIVCDQYGGAAPVGGGNLNGKDATKVDRSGVYMARYIAKNIVHEGLADQAIVQLAYEIGKPYAVSINVETDGTPFWKKKTLRNYVKTFDTSVQAIIDKFDLYHMSRTVHDECSKWGHIGSTTYINVGGKEVEVFPWERFD